MASNKTYGNFNEVYSSDSAFSKGEQYEIHRALGKASKALQLMGFTKFLSQFNPSTGKYEGSVALDAVTETLTIGTQANTAGSGTALTATTTGVVRVFSDDGGADLDTPDSVRGVQSRLLLTVPQNGCTIRSLQGQMKLLTGVHLGTGVYTAVQGYVELNGATQTVHTGGVFSCFDSSLEIGTSLTVDSGGKAFGLHVETTGAGTITNNGTCAAIGIDKATGAASWPVGVDIAASTCTTGISVGTSTTGISLPGTTTTGILLGGATTNGISITGAPATAAISITGAEATGLLIATSTPATGISITAACANAIAISGANTVTGISISGDQVLGVLFAATAAATAAYAVTVPTGITLDKGLDINVTSTGIVTSGLTMQGTGTFTTGITLSATTMTTGIAISAGSMTDAIKISGTTPADGIEISSACSANAINLSGGSAIGLMIARGVTQPIRIGNWAGSSATGSAIVISAVTDALDTTQRNIVAVYGESIADLGSGIHANVGRFRYLVNGITCNHESYGLVGQIRAKNVTFGHMHAGLMGTLEIDTAATINGAYTYGIAGVIARLGCGTSILTCTKAVCGFSAIYNGGALAGAAGSYAYGVDSTTATTWTAALALNLCDNLLFAATGTDYECGVKVAAQTVTNPETLAAIIRIKIGSTLYYIPAYAAGSLNNE